MTTGDRIFFKSYHKAARHLADYYGWSWTEALKALKMYGEVQVHPNLAIVMDTNA